MSLSICRPETCVRLLYVDCPTCKRRRRFTLWDTGYSYWSSHMTCWGCGDSWSDGERMERPFARGWRRERMARARAAWRERGVTAKQARAWMQAQMDAALGPAG